MGNEKPTDWRVAGSEGSWCLPIGFAAVVTVVALGLLLVSRMGLAFIGYQYSPDVLARINLASAVMLVAIVGFDVCVAIDRRWRYSGLAAAVFFLVLLVCVPVLFTKTI